MKADGEMRKIAFNRAVWPSHTTPARKAQREQSPVFQRGNTSRHDVKENPQNIPGRKDPGP